MSASMIAMRGRLQKEGEVIHIICDRITDHDAMLRSIAQGDVSIAPGRGDGARNGGGPDSRDAPLRIRNHHFHCQPLASWLVEPFHHWLPDFGPRLASSRQPPACSAGERVGIV